MVNNYIPLFYVDVITYPCLNQGGHQNMVLTVSDKLLVRHKEIFKLPTHVPSQCREMMRVHVFFFKNSLARKWWNAPTGTLQGDICSNVLIWIPLTFVSWVQLIIDQCWLELIVLAVSQWWRKSLTHYCVTIHYCAFRGPQVSVTCERSVLI